MQSDKMQYITAKNRLRENKSVLEGLQHFKKIGWSKISYFNDNFDSNIVNEYLSKYNVMITLEGGEQSICDLIKYYEKQVADYTNAVQELKNKIDKKYWDCEYYIEVLFG